MLYSTLEVIDWVLDKELKECESMISEQTKEIEELFKQTGANYRNWEQSECKELKELIPNRDKFLRRESHIEKAIKDFRSHNFN